MKTFWMRGWDSVEEMQKLLDMGMEEGMKLALGQMDALLDQV